MSRLALAVFVLALVAMVRLSAQGELSKELQSVQGTWSSRWSTKSPFAPRIRRWRW